MYNILYMYMYVGVGKIKLCGAKFSALLTKTEHVSSAISKSTWHDSYALHQKVWRTCWDSERS
jgi:hypothetical protein